MGPNQIRTRRSLGFLPPQVIFSVLIKKKVIFSVYPLPALTPAASSPTATGHDTLPRRQPRGLLRRRRGPPPRISMCLRLVFVAAALEGSATGLVGLRGGTGSGSPRRRRGIAVTARRRPVRGGVAGHARLHPEFALIILQIGIIPVH